MAGVTGRIGGHGRELAGVNVLMAAGALQRGISEHDTLHPDGKGGRFVALLAGGSAVRTGECETRPRMVEGGNLAPVLLVVAGLADGTVRSGPG